MVATLILSVLGYSALSGGVYALARKQIPGDFEAAFFIAVFWPLLLAVGVILAPGKLVALAVGKLFQERP